ncbi:MAG: glucose-6-phosphate isomerase family protein [Candidatus Omnitrophota bacterium]
MSALVDLKQVSGLELKLDTKNFRLSFGEGLTSPIPALRTLQEMQEVLLGKGIGQPGELYYMYRDVHLIKDADLLKKNNLRYDVTVIRPERLSKELMKTAGHYHPGNFGELYEVLQGEAFCLLQEPDPQDYRILKDVILVRARRGQKIVIPPGYGHILVNPGPGCLVTSNWVSSAFSSEYQLYKEAGGAAYFLVSKAPDKIEFIRNAFFGQLPEIRFMEPAERIDKFGLAENEPIYPLVSQNVQKLDFLNHPQNYDYSDVFKGALDKLYFLK